MLSMAALSLGTCDPRSSGLYSECHYMKQGMHMEAKDLWTGAGQDTDNGSVSARVGSHDCAAFRLSQSVTPVRTESTLRIWDGATA